jgi:hypothetical protein
MAYYLNRSSEDSCLRQKFERQLYVSASVAAFWLVLFSALADRPRPHQRWRLALLVAWCRSLCEPLICEPLARSGINETIKTHECMVLDVSFIKPERKFVNISAKMLAASVMVDADQTALEDGENAFNSIRGNGASHIFTRAVIDGFVFKGAGLDAIISASFIRVEHRAGFDALGDRILDGCFVGVSNGNGNRAAAALAHTEDGRFADGPATGFQLLGFMLVLFDPADKGFINFDDAFEFGEVRTAAGFPQPMQNEPSRFLRDPDFLGKLHRGYALARRHKQVHGVNPLMQRNVAALENRAGADRKVFLALIAAVVAASPRRDPLAHAANRAARAIGPQPPLKVRPRRLLVREHLEKLERRNRAFRHRNPLNSWENTSMTRQGSQVYKSHS